MGTQAAASSGFARRAGTAAYVMDTGHRCPASTWDHTMNPAARRTWAPVPAGSVHGLAVSPLGDRGVHELVPGRVELDLVDPLARGGMGAQHRGVGVGQLAGLLGLGAARELAEDGDVLVCRGAGPPSQALLEGGVGGKEAVADQRGDLVGDGVGAHVGSVGRAVLCDQAVAA